MPPPLRRNDVDVHELDGEAILFDARCDAMHRFNAVALFVWGACDGSHTLAEIAKATSTQYFVERKQARAAVEAAVSRFRALDLLDDENTATGSLPRSRSDTVAEEVLCPREPGRRGLTRREIVRGGATRLIFAAPVISTFFAQSAQASTVSPHGAGGCKIVGFSCTVNDDCCGSGAGDTQCETSECCIKQDKGTCDVDEDCCSGLTCDGGGVCRN